MEKPVVIGIKAKCLPGSFEKLLKSGEVRHGALLSSRAPQGSRATLGMRVKTYYTIFKLFLQLIRS